MRIQLSFLVISVLSQKFVAYFGESSAFLARRDDEEYREYFEEEQHRQGRRGPVKYVTNFWGRALVVLET